MIQENEIRSIAYSIWQEEGCRDGHDCEHWLRAEVIWEQQQKQQVAGKSVKTESKKTIKQKAEVVAAKKRLQRT